jgi:hypothetical protein
LNPHIHDLVFQLCTLFDPTMDSLDVNMIVVFHPTHSLVPLHIQMIINIFFQSHNEKLCPLKPHYPTTKTKKNNSYTIVIQLSLGYYNYYATIPLKIWCINK